MFKKYKSYYVSRLKPNSIDSKRILSKKLKEGLSSRAIVKAVGKRLGVSFRYDGKIGAYLIYKAAAKKVPYYYVLSIS